ncbi:hypothetical protein PVAP13_7NG269017, partial [Panicum virgatum]
MGSRGRGRGRRAHPALLAMPRAFAARLPASRARPPRAPCPARRRSAAAPSSRGSWSMKVSPPPARGSAPRRPPARGMPGRSRRVPAPPRAGHRSSWRRGAGGEGPREPRRASRRSSSA